MVKEIYMKEGKMVMNTSGLLPEIGDKTEIVVEEVIQEEKPHAVSWEVVKFYRHGLENEEWEMEDEYNI